MRGKRKTSRRRVNCWVSFLSQDNGWCKGRMVRNGVFTKWSAIGIYVVSKDFLPLRGRRRRLNADIGVFWHTEAGLPSRRALIFITGLFCRLSHKWRSKNQLKLIADQDGLFRDYCLDPKNILLLFLKVCWMYWIKFIKKFNNFICFTVFHSCLFWTEIFLTEVWC